MIAYITLIVILGITNVNSFLTNQQHQLIENIRYLNREMIVDKLMYLNNESQIAIMHEKIKQLHKLGLKMSFIYLQHNISDVLQRPAPNMKQTLLSLMSTYKTVISWCNPRYQLPTNTSGREGVCSDIEGCFAILYNNGNNQPCGFMHFHNYHLNYLNSTFMITVHHLFFIRLHMIQIELCTAEYGNVMTLYSSLTNKVIKRLHGKHPAFFIDINHNEVAINLLLEIYRCKTLIDIQYSAIDIPVSFHKACHI